MDTRTDLEDPMKVSGQQKTARHSILFPEVFLIEEFRKQKLDRDVKTWTSSPDMSANKFSGLDGLP